MDNIDYTLTLPLLQKIQNHEICKYRYTKQDLVDRWPLFYHHLKLDSVLDLGNIPTVLVHYPIQRGLDI